MGLRQMLDDNMLVVRAKQKQPWGKKALLRGVNSDERNK